MWRGDENQLPATARRLGIAVVKSVAECLDILVQIDAKPRTEPGMIGRVMRLLGLNETTSA